jgi:DNA replication protein DnaC
LVRNFTPWGSQTVNIYYKRAIAYSAHDFFEVLSKRYKKGLVIITIKKSFESCGEIFTDFVLVSVIIDRIVHYSVVININNQSYKTKDINKRGGETK